MSLLEGHGNAAMYGATSGLIADPDGVRDHLGQRRGDVTSKVLNAVGGMEIKRRQYVEGEAFVDARHRPRRRRRPQPGLRTGRAPAPRRRGRRSRRVAAARVGRVASVTPDAAGDPTASPPTPAGPRRGGLDRGELVRAVHDGARGSRRARRSWSPSPAGPTRPRSPTSLAEARPDLVPVLGHVRHGLRDDADDAALVRQHAAFLGVRVAVREVEVVAAGRGLEAAARDARYAALRTLADRGRRRGGRRRAHGRRPGRDRAAAAGPRHRDGRAGRDGAAPGRPRPTTAAGAPRRRARLRGSRRVWRRRTTR